MKSYAYLFWGYNVVWIGIAGYLAFLYARLRTVSRRLDRVETKLAGGEERGTRAE